MDLDETSNETTAIAALARLADETLPAQMISTPDGRVFAIHRDDVQMRDITPPNKAEVYPPKIIALTTQLQTAIALTQYLHRFKDADSLMFADVTNSRITAILDYHVRPVANTPVEMQQPVDAGVRANEGAKPRHSAHRAVLQLRHSKEWQVWTGMNEKLVKHAQFIDFLEENALDVQNPSAAGVLEICRDLQVKAGTAFKTTVRDGDYVNISYQKDNDVTTAGEVRMPSELEIAIPVYFGELPVSMRVLLRRKVDDGELWLGFKILRLENHKQDEFLRIANTIEADTSVESVLGNPA